jgi:trehalose 6-phosphate phosphatase
MMVSRVLAAIDGRPSNEQLVMLSDFDGTLAPYHPDPAAPTLSADIKDVLETLATRHDTAVGLVSGRRLDDLDLRTRLSRHVYLAGLHGLEIRHEAQAWHHPDLVDSREVTDVVTKAIADRVGHIRGVKLEHKGVAVTVHVRAVAPHLRDEVLCSARDAASAWLDAGTIKAIGAHYAVELLPNIGWTKGDAVRWILEDVERRVGRPAWCVFFGDDETDEDAFRAIDRGLTVVVGRRPSAARMRLRSPSEVANVLARLNGNGHAKEDRR